MRRAGLDSASVVLVGGRVMNRWLLACVVLGGFAASANAAEMAVVGPYQAPTTAPASNAAARAFLRPSQPPPIAPLYSWTGCYIGVNMGGGAAPIGRIDELG